MQRPQKNDTDPEIISRINVMKNGMEYAVHHRVFFFSIHALLGTVHTAVRFRH